jgi:hypothetical protein
MDRIDILFGICMAILVCNLIYIGDTFLIPKDREPALLYNEAFFNKEMTGVYMPDVGFFVDTRGRNLEQINKTLHHEMLHALITQDKDSREHFCGDE